MNGSQKVDVGDGEWGRGGRGGLHWTCYGGGEGGLRQQGGRRKERGRFHSILAKALIRNEAFQPVDNFFF